MQAALLSDRGIVRVTGEDSRRFLNNIITADIEALAPGAARFAALLTPQGKIIVDFFVTEAAADDGGGFYFDCPKASAGLLADGLKFYKLRARIEIEDLSDRLGVLALWPDAAASEFGLSYPDPRLPALGSRVILPPEATAEAAGDLGATLTDAEAYHRHRIALAVPQGGQDFNYGDTFPHEADMDQLHGVDFDKGCYVGQEVVSRVQHRATARSRIVPLVYEGPAPMDGLPVMAGDREIGMFGSSAGGRGLALLRLDRVADAIADGTQLIAGGVPLSLAPEKPDWVTFPWPGDAPNKA
jgi:folate-binding protein YgfZ